MVAAVHDLLKALARSGITIEAHGDSLRYRPASAMSPDLLAAVKSCKSELLELLVETANASKADVEVARFSAVAQPLAGGSGWYDPTQAPVPVGVPGERWDAFVADCGRLGRGSKT